MEVRYLTVEQVQFLHDDQIKLYTPDEPLHVIDRGALESTCSRPSQTHYYEQDSDICDLAASLGFGLAKNHVFANANKRTAAVCTHVFLQINGYALEMGHWLLVKVFEDLANGKVDQRCLAEILADNVRAMTDEERAEFEKLANGT